MQSLAPSITTVNKQSIAFVMGAADAAQRLVCCPEMVVTHIDDKRDYCRGYEYVSGPTLTTQQFLGGNH